MNYGSPIKYPFFSLRYFRHCAPVFDFEWCVAALLVMFMDQLAPSRNNL